MKLGEGSSTSYKVKIIKNHSTQYKRCRYFANTADVVSLISDRCKAGDKIVVGDAEIVHEFSGRETPNKQRKRFLGFVSADEYATVLGHQQRVEEAILSSFKSGHAVARIEVHQVHVHSVAGQCDEVLVIVQTKIGHFLVHHAFESRI
jgi:hypothetical protein